MKARTEYLYDKSSNLTRIFIWRGMELLGKHMVHGTIEGDAKKLMDKNLIKKFSGAEYD